MISTRSSWGERDEAGRGRHRGRGRPGRADRGGELADAGRRVLLLDQEPQQSLGGQAWWSFGGLFFVDSPEQRRWRIRDSVELAWQDWLGTAAFDRPEDELPRQWARAYAEFAAGEKRAWLHAMGHRLFPVPGWAERGGHTALGHGNSVPRFHITWGTGPGVVHPFERRVRADHRVERIFGVLDLAARKCPVRLAIRRAVTPE